MEEGGSVLCPPTKRSEIAYEVAISFPYFKLVHDPGGFQGVDHIDRLLDRDLVVDAVQAPTGQSIPWVLGCSN